MTKTQVSDLSAGARREVARRRLAAMRIAPTDRGDASVIAGTVRSSLAMQAQDLASGCWSIGVRTGASLADVEAAVDARQITRSWPMRGTLHFLATEDVRWMCRLLNDPTNAGIRARWAGLEITDAVLDHARDVVVVALARGGRLSRPAAMDLLREHGISPDGQRGLHILSSFCRDGLLCLGPAEGRQPTFVLLEEWVPWSWDPGREEAMASLAERYVLSHGPVTEKDLAGWIAKPLGFAREAIALAGERIGQQRIGGASYLVHVDAPPPAARPGLQLLPGFDEYILGYKDRSAMLTSAQERLVVPGGNGVFLPTVVLGGQVIGTWGRRVTNRKVEVTVAPFRDLTTAHRRDVARAAAAYGDFLGLPAEVSYQGSAT
ncbi:MAG: winged helix DNA-binding domain-containing protein [Actinomycetota bacterium]